jgi:hypothetical protein
MWNAHIWAAVFRRINAQVLKQLKNKKIRILVATDLVSEYFIFFLSIF